MAPCHANRGSSVTWSRHRPRAGLHGVALDLTREELPQCLHAVEEARCGVRAEDDCSGGDVESVAFFAELCRVDQFKLDALGRWLLWADG